MLNANQADMQQEDVPVEQMQQTQEKMIPQSEVDKIIGSVRQQARATQPQQAGMSPEQIQQLVDNQVEAKLHAERQAMERHHHETHAHKVIEDLKGKLAPGFEKYPNFNEMLDSIWPAGAKNSLPEMVMLLNGVDNPADIVADLYENPIKVGQLASTWDKAPHVAHNAMQKLSDSIKKNETAEKLYKQPKEPMSQLKSSTISQDNGPMSVSDLRRLPQFRG